MLQAVLFDYDGTLSPTSIRQEKWFKTWANKHGIQWPFNSFQEFLTSYNHYCGKEGGVQNVYDFLKLPCDMKDRNHPVWDAYEKFNKENPQTVYPGIKETVREIWRIGQLGANPQRNRRLRLGINTSNSWKSIHNDLEKGDIIQYFDTFITEEVLRQYQGAGNGDSLKKPSKVSLAMALGLLDSEGESTLHVDDTLNGLVASQKVMRLNPLNPETLITVGACYGYEGRTILEQGAEGGKIKFDYLIDKPEELISIVEKLLKRRNEE